MSATYDKESPFSFAKLEQEDLEALGIKPSGLGRGLRIPRRSRIEPAVHTGMQDPELVVKPNSPLWAKAAQEAGHITRKIVEAPFERPIPQAS